MCQNMKTPSTEALLSLYQTTCSEITRYRDREWQNLGLFTAAIAAVIGFVLTQPNQVKTYSVLFYLTFGVLVIGNIFFTCFAHDRLTIQRTKQKALEKALGLAGLKVDEFEVVQASNDHLCKRQDWTRGFLSHLLPFFLADIALAIYGIWLVYTK